MAGVLPAYFRISGHLGSQMSGLPVRILTVLRVVTVCRPVDQRMELTNLTIEIDVLSRSLHHPFLRHEYMSSRTG
jgi:hypothetical protein